MNWKQERHFFEASNGDTVEMGGQEHAKTLLEVLKIMRRKISTIGIQLLIFIHPGT